LARESKVGTTQLAVQNAAKSQETMRAISRPDAFFVDELPPSTYKPGWLQPGRKIAEAAAKAIMNTKIDSWRRFEEQVLNGKAPHCYTREIYENKESWYAQGLTEEHLIWVSTGLVEARFETTAATLNSLVLRLSEYLRVQEEAQKELMSVVGPDRLPTFADLRNLPYVRGCVKVLLRINPILAPGIRQFTTEDVRYEDHVIPKGTILLANTAYLHTYPSRYEDQFDFKPERYLNHLLYSSE
jgi:cytochrome P450